MQYRQALRFDDVIDVHLLLAAVTRTTFQMAYLVTRDGVAVGDRGDRARRRHVRRAPDPPARLARRDGGQPGDDALVHVRPPLRARQHHPLLRPPVRRRRRDGPRPRRSAGTRPSTPTTRCGCSATWRWGASTSRCARRATLAGTKRLVPGNHDRCWAGRGDVGGRRGPSGYVDAGFAEILPEQVDLGDRRRARRRACHFPYDGDSHDEARLRRPTVPSTTAGCLLHGHVHTRWRVDGRQVNVGCDVWDYRPVAEDAIVRRRSADDRREHPTSGVRSPATAAHDARHEPQPALAGQARRCAGRCARRTAGRRHRRRGGGSRTRSRPPA